MFPFKRLLVALDRSSSDEDLIRYTEFLSKLYRPEDIYFVHVEPDLSKVLDFPLHSAGLREWNRPADEEILHLLQNKIRRYFNAAGNTRLHVEVIEGRPESKLPHWVDVKQIDLVLLGRHRDNLDSSVRVLGLLRHIPCAVWIVPEGTEPVIQSIALPLDFSRESSSAIACARHIAARLDDVHLRIIHVYDVPPGHFQLSRTEAQFDKIIEANARDMLERFLDQNEAASFLATASLFREEGRNPAREIQRSLREQPADLVVMGAKGRNAVERFLVGSVTESLLDRSDSQPMLIIR